MATRRVNGPNEGSSKASRRPPARSLEDRENQLIALAFDLAEKQITEGTASAQVITHYLKLGSTSEKLAQKYKTEEIKLLQIRAETMASTKRTEELMGQALEAFKAYSGQGPMPDLRGGGDEDPYME